MRPDARALAASDILRGLLERGYADLRASVPEWELPEATLRVLVRDRRLAVTVIEPGGTSDDHRAATMVGRSVEACWSALVDGLLVADLVGVDVFAGAELAPESLVASFTTPIVTDPTGREGAPRA